jgi:hypothetical protein
MTSITIISALLGICLGLTFRVFILVPAALLALAILAGNGATSEAGAFWMIVFDISAIAAMQAGYIGGNRAIRSRGGLAHPSCEAGARHHSQ